jgi:hypothetical protein
MDYRVETPLAPHQGLPRFQPLFIGEIWLNSQKEKLIIETEVVLEAFKF